MDRPLDLQGPQYKHAHRSFLTTTADASDDTTNGHDDADDADSKRLEAVAGALQVCVLLGIEREIAVFHPGYRLMTR